jgi:hypothetical protein
MPKVIIPDKICPHCGGNIWYISKTTNICYLKVQKKYLKYRNIPENKEKQKKLVKIYQTSKEGKESLKRAKNKQSKRLTDYYIKNLMYIHFYRHHGTTIDRKTITPEMIDKYRQGLKAKRQLRQLKNENK